ncbi:unnamed protein product, partial [Ectocarpus fasciculatus]
SGQRRTQSSLLSPQQCVIVLLSLAEVDRPDYGWSQKLRGSFVRLNCTARERNLGDQYPSRGPWGGVVQRHVPIGGTAPVE